MKYLAPLNYDRFFRKVFSDNTIAKQFLEDFLEAKIEEIEQLGDKHRITDDAAIVEFDYRCKINGKYIIIDMQQWYKPDVIRRFYLYHSLKDKYVISDPLVSKGKVKQKNYSLVEPVYTLIWMVDDNLNFSGDYAEFSLNHQDLINFVRDEHLWLNPDIYEIAKRRKEIVQLTDNQFKDVNFLAENKLVFMFQKNIASNLESNRSNKKYKRWFDFATKTKDDNNNVNDFTEFTNDKVFSEVIKRLRRDKLTDDDIKYIESEEEHIKLTQDFYLKQKLQLEQEKQEGIDIGVGIGVDKGIGIGVKKEKAKNKAEKNKMIKNMESKGLSVEAISDLTGLSLEEIKNIKADD